MDAENSVIYGLEYHARALTAQIAESDKICYYIGTLSLKQSVNQIHQIEFNDETSTVNTKLYQYNNGEIWRLTSSPFNTSRLAVCSTLATGESSCSALTEIINICTDEDGKDEVLKTSTQMDVKDFGNVKTTEFHVVDESKAATLTDTHFIFWDISQNTARNVSNIVLQGRNTPKFTIGKWNPHQNCNQFTTATESNIKTYDLRTNDCVWQIENAHSLLIRDLDYNPNKMYHFATCGDDGFVKIWDFREHSHPVYSRCDHNHWVWSVRFNPLHDQLILTSSSDGKVIISGASNVSSENGRSEFLIDENEYKKTIQDGPLQWCEHEDSVYAAEWSPAEPWVFASLSYDGRLLISRVKKSLKMKIMFNS